MTTATAEQPPTPVAPGPARMVVVAVAVAVAVVGVVWVALGPLKDSVSTGGELRAAFPDIADPAWRCSSDDEFTAGYLYVCETAGGPYNAPTVLFLEFPEPITIDATVAEVEAAHREAARENQSGIESELTLLGTDDWAPADGSAWGRVARFRFDNRDIGDVVYSAYYRYADKPFGVTVYARSLGELDQVAASLDLPAPADLPG